MISPTADLWFFSICAFFFGLVFGSFLNVCIYRLPRGLSVVSPRSACPGCHAPVAAYDNIPLLSWLILRGKCRHCKRPISSRYWIVELLTGLLFFACVWRFGVELTAIKFCVFAFLTLGLIFTDADTKILPDALTIPGIWIGLLFSPFVAVSGAMGLLYRVLPIAPLDPRLASVINALIGAAFGAGFIYLIGELWLRLRGVEAMGFGDVKLMAMVGAFVGAKLTLLTLFFGSLFGSLAGITIVLLVRRKRMRRWNAIAPQKAAGKAEHATTAMMSRFGIPFGVFLGAGAVLSAFFGEPIMAWYLGFYR